MITKAEIEKHLRFNPANGCFYWTARRGSMEEGSIAGRTDSRGHRQITLNGRSYLAHRLAWTVTHGAWPDHPIDHKNGDRSDNRPKNLRACTFSQNCANSRIRKDSSIGLKGVTTHGNRFRAQICKDRQKILLGVFATKEEAHAAYVAASKVLFGKFARSG